MMTCHDLGNMFHVGDRVIVRDDLRGGEEDYHMLSGRRSGYSVIATYPMTQFAGQEVTITGIFDEDHWAYGTYAVDVTRDEYAWTDEMFSGLAAPTWDTESIADMTQLFQ